MVLVADGGNSRSRVLVKGRKNEFYVNMSTSCDSIKEGSGIIMIKEFAAPVHVNSIVIMAVETSVHSRLLNAILDIQTRCHTIVNETLATP